ncbi:CQS_1a_G0044080.mRNA.1.CDS.1 [Saccharomyces cerevisiae]|nr:CQS_1a_G0044080.mRNA.1.CDS.1 [Saccharomyces cerevisiae]CAI7437913.1 CQS_1a_G0044080.mRNA.1.CDS.1 [Saccharomyces cerevisiae]
MNGIFAIEKPSGITSNQFMLKLQHALTKSQVFSKEIQRATAERKQQYEKQTGKKASKRKLRKVSKVKMGHGGTLDPLASGVLVIGIGAGTKKLANYLSGTVKVYESEALFGVSTTSGDVEGEILSQNSVKHLNFDDLKTVEEKFVGQLKQTPPIYAALKMDGKPLHEYAREGKPLPRAIEPRQVTIYDLKVFSDSLKRDHDYPLLRPTTEEAVDTVKNLNANMLNDVLYFSKEYTEKHSLDSEVAKVEEPFPLSEQEEQEIQKEGDSYRAPKLHFKANVSSGTYIRSLVSDIGKSMRSSCYMVKLIRLQQQDWSLEKNNVFQLTDFTERDEKVWSKVLEKVLDEGATVDVIEELKKAEKEIPADVKECIVSSDQPGDEATAETIETANAEEHSNTLKRKIEQV